MIESNLVVYILMSKIKKIKYSSNVSINRRLLSDSNVILIVPRHSDLLLYSKPTHSQIYTYAQVLNLDLYGRRIRTVIVKPHRGYSDNLIKVMYQLGMHQFPIVEYCGLYEKE